MQVCMYSVAQDEVVNLYKSLLNLQVLSMQKLAVALVCPVLTYVCCLLITLPVCIHVSFVQFN